MKIDGQRLLWGLIGAIALMIVGLYIAAEMSLPPPTYSGDGRSLSTTPDAATASFTSSSMQPSTRPTIRCAVIGGMFFTGFWDALAARYQAQTGVHIEMVADGPKDDIRKVFLAGNVDVITMHASDTMVNLVADGYAVDPQPWLRNDLILVGPAEDPAGIRGMSDAAAALKKIADAKAPFVVHSSLGAQEVLVNILQPDNIQLDASNTTILFDDQQRTVLTVAAAKHAYTMVGRIPFLIGRLPNAGLVMMVQGDPRLRRPYLVATANPQRLGDIHAGMARKFAEFLRAPATQEWIAGWKNSSVDDLPVFFPVTLPE